MSYRVEQKIGKHIYVYEAEGYWDPEKKQSRQRRRYIGKKDPVTGEIITPRKTVNPKRSRNFGAIYLLRQIAAHMGFIKSLEKAFRDDAEDLFNLAAYQVCEAQPFNGFKYWVESTFIKKQHHASSQAISRLLKYLGTHDKQTGDFIHDWIYGQPASNAVVFDITSLSSYGKGLDMLEWGYNRDGDRLPQINLGVTMRVPDGIPLSYHVYPGSISDVSTLKGIIEELQAHKISIRRFVLDRGFYSKTNIHEMADHGIPFIVPLPFSTKLSSELITDTKTDLEKGRNAFVFRKQTLFHTMRKVTIDGVHCDAHVFLDNDRKNRELNTLVCRMSDYESWFSSRKFESIGNAKREIREKTPSLQGYYKLELAEDKVILSRKDRRLSHRMNRMGKTVILTRSTGLDREEILDLYRRKDRVEKLFDTLKNELNCDRLRIHSRETMDGRLFISFLSLILHFALTERMHENDLHKKYTVRSLLKTLDTLRTIEMANGKGKLTEITKKQREIYEAMHIPVPVAPRY